MLKSWFLRILFGTILVVAGVLGWKIWTLSQASSTVADVPAGMVAGPSSADLTVTMLFDYECPHCHKAYPILLDAAQRDGRVKIALRPIAPGSPNVGAYMALAANAQGKFLEFHDALMQIDPPLSEETCRKAAEEAGLDWAKMQADSKTPDVQAFLDEGIRQAIALSINSTPTIIVGPIVYKINESMPTATDFLRLFNEARGGFPPASQTPSQPVKGDQKP